MGGNPHVLHIGEVDDEMMAEMQLIIDQRYKRQSKVNTLDYSRVMNVNPDEVRRYKEHLDSSNLDEAFCFAADTVEAAREVDNYNENACSVGIETIDYDSLKLLGRSSWKKTYNIYAPSVPTSIRIIYTRVGEILQ